MIRKTSSKGTPALDLLDEGVALLRAAPTKAWGIYMAGNGLFLLGLLYFLADMSRNPFAMSRLPLASLGLAFLYIVHRTAQHQFCRFLHAQLREHPQPQITPRDCWNSFCVQLRYSPWSLLLLPIASVIIIPLAWCIGYHQNLVCRGESTDETGTGAHQQAKRLAQLWPMQNHIVLTVLSFYIVLAFLNLMIVTLYAPQLLKSLLGVHTPFTDSYYWIGSTTYLAVLVALTYLATDPFVKAVYVLRCHAGQCLHSGEDIRINWRRRVRQGLGAGLAVVLVMLPLTSGQADTVRYVKPTEELERTEIVLEQVTELEEQVNKQVADPRNAWRMPKEKVVVPLDEQGLFARTAIAFGNLLKSIVDTIGESISSFFEWLVENMFGDPERLFDTPDRDRPEFSTSSLLQIMAWSLVGLLCCAIAVVFYRRMKYANREIKAEAQLSSVTPDLDDESTLATDLPEDEWLAMAVSLLAKGDTRRAMRAFFLAGLASCSRLKVIDVAKAKTNRDYLYELERKGGIFPDLLPAYKTMRSIFEPRWYGIVPVLTDDCETLHDLAKGMRQHEV